MNKGNSCYRNLSRTRELIVCGNTKKGDSIWFGSWSVAFIRRLFFLGFYFVSAVSRFVYLSLATAVNFPPRSILALHDIRIWIKTMDAQRSIDISISSHVVSPYKSETKEIMAMFNTIDTFCGPFYYLTNCVIIISGYTANLMYELDGNWRLDFRISSSNTEYNGIRILSRCLCDEAQWHKANMS